MLRVWRQAKGACWALPSARTRHLLIMMVRTERLRRRILERRLTHLLKG